MYRVYFLQVQSKQKQLKEEISGEVKMKIFLSGCALLLFAGASKGSYFDCRRLGNECQKGGSCNNNGTCSCPGLNESIHHLCISKSKSSCTKACQNGGSCFKDGSLDMCLCKDAFTGDECGLPRMHVTCTMDTMEVIVRPGEDFSGKIYATGKHKDGNCTFTNASVTNYTITLDLVDNFCGLSFVNDSNGIKITLDVTIQYVTKPLDLLTDTDQYLQAICIFNDSIKLVNALEIADVSRDNILEEIVQGQEDNLVTFDIMDVDGTKSINNTSLKIGNVIKLVISMKRNAVFDSILLNDVQASPGGNSTDIMYIVKNGCPDTLDVLLNHSSSAITRSSDNLNITVSITAFKFLDSRELVFTTSVIMCSSKHSSHCVQEICFPASSPVPVSSPPTSLSSSPPSSISPSPPTSLSSSPPSTISPSPPTSLSSSPPSSISPSPPISLSSSPPSSISPSPPSSISPSPPTPLSPLSPTSPPTSLITASSSSTLATNTISIATSDLAPTLPADTSPSRRRRDAGSLEMVFTGRIHVNDETPLENNDNNVENTDEIKNKKENPNVNFQTCLQNSDIQILVALLTAGLLILLVMCFVTIACLLRKSNRKQNFDPDNLSVTSSMQILYVPRVKI